MTQRQGKVIPAGDFGLTRAAAAERAAFLGKGGACRAVDGAVDAAARGKLRVGGGDDGVDLHFGNIVADKLYGHGKNHLAENKCIIIYKRKNALSIISRGQNECNKGLLRQKP